MFLNIKTADRTKATFGEFKALVGGPAMESDWVVLNQDLILNFADVTGDDAFIHTNPARAEKTRFKGTIAHGLLTLSLLPILMRSATPELINGKMGVNYGFDRIRFVEPVPVNAKVRARFKLAEVIEVKPGFYKFIYDISVEIEGHDRPALLARWLLGRWIEPDGDD